MTTVIVPTVWLWVMMIAIGIPFLIIDVLIVLLVAYAIWSAVKQFITGKHSYFKQ